MRKQFTKAEHEAIDKGQKKIDGGAAEDAPESGFLVENDRLRVGEVVLVFVFVLVGARVGLGVRGDGGRGFREMSGHDGGQVVLVDYRAILAASSTCGGEVRVN